MRTGKGKKKSTIFIWTLALVMALYGFIPGVGVALSFADMNELTIETEIIENEETEEAIENGENEIIDDSEESDEEVKEEAKEEEEQEEDEKDTEATNEEEINENEEEQDEGTGKEEKNGNGEKDEAGAFEETILIEETQFPVGTAEVQESVSEPTKVYLHKPHENASSDDFNTEKDCGGLTDPVVWHFILNGTSDEDATSLVLKVEFEDAGSKEVYGQPSGNNQSGQGAIHFYIGTSDHDILLSASVQLAHDYSDSQGQSGPGLVLSHVCFNEPEVTEITPLNFQSVCSDIRGYVKFRVDNPNDFDVEIEYLKAGQADSERQSLTAAGAGEGESEGYTFFYVEADEGPNTTKIFWLDEEGIEQSVTKASGNLICQYEVRVDKTWMNAMEEPMEGAPDDVDWKVIITTSQGTVYELDNDTPSKTIWLDFDETFTITEEVPEGFTVYGTGTYSRDGDEDAEIIAVYGDGPSWYFKGEGKYYGSESHGGETAVVTVMNMEDPEDPEEPQVPEDSTPPTTIITGTGGGGGTPVAPAEVINVEPEVPLAPPVEPQQDPEVIIVLDEEVPLAPPTLPQTGEGRPIPFYLMGSLAALTGLLIRRKITA